MDYSSNYLSGHFEHKIRFPDIFLSFRRSVKLVSFFWDCNFSDEFLVFICLDESSNACLAFHFLLCWNQLYKYNSICCIFSFCVIHLYVSWTLSVNCMISHINHKYRLLVAFSRHYLLSLLSYAPLKHLQFLIEMYTYNKPTNWWHQSEGFSLFFSSWFSFLLSFPLLVTPRRVSFFTEVRPFWPMVCKMIQRVFINMIFSWFRHF